MVVLTPLLQVLPPVRCLLLELLHAFSKHGTASLLDVQTIVPQNVSKFACYEALIPQPVLVTPLFLVVPISALSEALLQSTSI